jgi:hypothetical protein
MRPLYAERESLLYSGAPLETGIGDTSANKVHKWLYEALQYEGSFFRKNLFCAATQRHTKLSSNQHSVYNDTRFESAAVYPNSCRSSMHSQP